MDAEIKQICEEIVKSSAEEKVKRARGSLAVLLQGLEKAGLNDDQKRGFVFNIVKLFVSADASCTGYEYSFFKAVTGIEPITKDQFYAMTNHGRDPQFVDAMVEAIGAFDSETKCAIVYFGVTFLASDLELTQDEFALIDRFFE